MQSFYYQMSDIDVDIKNLKDIRAHAELRLREVEKWQPSDFQQERIERWNQIITKLDDMISVDYEIKDTIRSNL